MTSLAALCATLLAALPAVAPFLVPAPVGILVWVSNAISVLHEVPLGGEDLARYTGPPQLVRANGDEDFDTVADGQIVIEHPEPGEIIWRDDRGVTCRRWNWRQGRRTQLTDETTSALFILDALEPLDDEAPHATVDHLAECVSRLGPDVRIARRVIGAGSAQS